MDEQREHLSSADADSPNRSHRVPQTPLALRLGLHSLVCFRRLDAVSTKTPSEQH